VVNRIQKTIESEKVKFGSKMPRTGLQLGQDYQDYYLAVSILDVLFLQYLEKL